MTTARLDSSSFFLLLMALLSPLFAVEVPLTAIIHGAPTNGCPSSHRSYQDIGSRWKGLSCSIVSCSLLRAYRLFAFCGRHQATKEEEKLFRLKLRRTTRRSNAIAAVLRCSSPPLPSAGEAPPCDIACPSNPENEQSKEPEAQELI